MPTKAPDDKPRFCTNCGAQLNADARFCHKCGSPIQGRATRTPIASDFSKAVRWGVPAVALVALVALAAVQLAREAKVDPAAGLPPGMGAAPDISSMSPEERADRLFNRVMMLSSEGKTDSVAFFAPMALSALEAIRPLTAHGRYDIALVALAVGDVPKASAQADTILAERPTHLLGLGLAARVANMRGAAAAAAAYNRRLLAAEQSERQAALPEYADHDADIRAAVALARTAAGAR